MMGKQEQMGPNEYRAILADDHRREGNRANAKYGNRFTEVDGINFHSAKEAQYYGKLKLRIKAKDILKFDRQKEYILKVNGIRVGKYIADYVEYFPGGRVDVVDIKSVVTREIESYKIKKALMLAVFGITIIEK